MAARKTGLPQGSTAPRRTMFVSLRNGLEDLVNALVRRLTEQSVMLRSGAVVESLRVRSHQLGRWTYDVMLNDGSALSVDSLVSWPSAATEIETADFAIPGVLNARHAAACALHTDVLLQSAHGGDPGVLRDGLRRRARPRPALLSAPRDGSRGRHQIGIIERAIGRGGEHRIAERYVRAATG